MFQAVHCTICNAGHSTICCPQMSRPIKRCMPCVQAAADWSDIISDESLDAVVIGTWPYLHHTIVLAALAANKHVLTEARLVSLPCTFCNHTCKSIVLCHAANKDVPTEARLSLPITRKKHIEQQIESLLECKRSMYSVMHKAV